MADRSSSLLVIILDTNPVWWGQRLLKQDADLVLSQCLDAVMVFSNSHLMLNHKNKLAIIAAHTDSSKFLFPKPESSETYGDASSGEATQRGGKDGKYELFAQVDNDVVNQIQDLVLNESGGHVTSDTLTAGAMCMALCYIHRMERECAVGEKLSSRILVIKGSEDNPSQYMNLMNVIFTAQKENLIIDACVLDNESGLLQQACDITGGMYLRIPQPAGLLQYLMWVFLPDPSTRSQLTLPPRAKVDYRAACFCHRSLIDIGYVCSVCLSIFCTFSPICSTCQTTFKIMGPPKGLKKKSKKTS